jgi:hypothetical protein
MVSQIETPEAMRMIEEIAQRTGETSTEIVEIALRERLDRVRAVETRIARKAELQALADSLAARFRASGQPLLDHGDLLYGEDGLPR